MIEEYVNKSVIGFDGKCFLEAEYCDTNYMAILKKEIVIIYSDKLVNSNSKKYRNGYKTELSIESVDDLFRVKMFAIFKGNKYEVQIVSPYLKSIELLARDGHESEDIKLGFEDNIHERVTHMMVNRDMIEELLVEKTSILNEIKDKMKIAT